MTSLLFSALAVFTLANAQEESYAAKMAKTAMSIWNDSAFVKAGKTSKWTYDQAVVLHGIEGLWNATADKKYFDYIQKSMDRFVMDDGSIDTYKYDEFTLDNIAPGRDLLLLYQVTGKQNYLKAVRTLRRQIAEQPRTNEGGFWHKKDYPSQMRLDGLYMAEPFYCEYATEFHEDTVFNDIARQFILMEQHAKDPKTGLLYHSYDESRQQKWADPKTGNSPYFWARGMGWYGMGLIDVLEIFPSDHPQRAALIQILNRYAEAIAKVQDNTTGLWWDILNMPGKEKNYFEASASSMFVYTLAKGVRLGYLPSKYAEIAKKGYKGIIKTFIKDEGGQAQLEGTVSASGLGGKPYQDGTYAYYMSEKVIVNDPKGVGAFIQAANEMELLSTTKYGKGKVVRLDNYFNHELKQDATGVTVPYHYVWNEKNYNGYSMFGFVFNKYGVYTTTLSTAPTSKNLASADIYIIVDPDTEKETKQPNYIENKDIDVIYQWVKDGGVLLLLGNDTGNVEFKHFNQLAAKFGFQFNYDSKNKVTGNQYEMGAFTIPESHPIFKTAKKIYIKEYASQTVSGPAKPIFTDGQTVVMSVAKVGKGTVFAVGDPWFYNEYLDGRKLPASFENYKAAEDLVKWAIDQSSKK